ncbi:MAG: hypothetical protein E6600_04525 [Anaerocolumna aminovalerica]|uniref:hypothetical protein n=1 Tax=Anaerocolumna aminovalerica TaxID=1527 RepID=UPI0029155845|nr:hypothetical protein [Anaerocolumna aminovalerica]MDU6263747.1 hypothetical protein [Anaerocolumna aminovalerica]
MESRNVKITIGKPGGNASKGSHTYKISLPNAWMNELKIDKENRECKITYIKDENRIVIDFKKSPAE